MVTAMVSRAMTHASCTTSSCKLYKRFQNAYDRCYCNNDPAVCSSVFALYASGHISHDEGCYSESEKAVTKTGIRWPSAPVSCGSVKLYRQGEATLAMLAKSGGSQF